jgi:SAM-dependent methyltransferase
VVAAVERRLAGQRLRILDAGCGTGEVARRLRGLGHSVIGLELSTEMLAEATRQSRTPPSSPAYLRGSIVGLPLRSESFDAVVCIGVLPHLPRRWLHGRIRDEEVEAVRELIRVLRPDGFLVISYTNLLRLHWLLDPVQLWSALMHRRLILEEEGRAMTQDLGQADRGSLPGPSWTRRRTSGEMRRFLSDNDLEILEWVGIGFGPFTLLGRQVFPFKCSVRLSARLERITRKPSFHRLGRLASTWVITLAPRPSREDRSPCR